MKEITSCFFCGKVCVPLDHVHTKEFIHGWIAEHGDFIKFKGKIGKYSVCENCAGDIYELLECDSCEDD